MCLLTTGIGSLSAQTRGTITATIVDQAGHPVVGARVAVVPADAQGLMGAPRECLTDGQDMCSQDLRFGKYHVKARLFEHGFVPQ
jgi:hypothetical protein